MTASSPVISVRSLSKSYGDVVGVEDITFPVMQGEIFGFLGPNGAGKTTCIRLILDLLRPDRGTIEIFGNDIEADRSGYKERVGNLPGEVAWWPALTGREVLDFFGRFRLGRRFRPGCPVLQEELLDRLGLGDPVLGRKVSTYSRGMRRKLGLVTAMQHDPDLLILDEPTSGLDPLVRHDFFDILRGLRERGKTVFLSSHNLAETHEICDRVGIIRAGRLVALTGLDDLRVESVRRVKATFACRPEKEWFAGLEGVDVLGIEDNVVLLAGKGDPAPLLEALAGRPLTDIIIKAPALDDLFLSLFPRNDRGEGEGSP
jgi:ABC-2 type transport system ATP-binding protein